MKKKNKNKKEVIKRPKALKAPEKMLDMFLLYYPEAYDLGFEYAKDVMAMMEEKSKKMNYFSPESICYWLNLASFSDAVLKDIQFRGQFYHPEKNPDGIPY